MAYEKLKQPEALGVELVNGFVDQVELAEIIREVSDPDRVQWLDAHQVYQNKRGLTITQNHFAFALKLSRGDQSPLAKLPRTVALKDRTQQFIRNLADLFPSLADWQADELSFHLYDNQEVGLSRHRDNLRFIGLVAVISLGGQCDLVVSHRGQDVRLPLIPGDLCLMRAPGLFETEAEIRPEHSVQNLPTGQRLAMIIRANSRPDEMIPGFEFNNWP